MKAIARTAAPAQNAITCRAPPFGRDRLAAEGSSIVSISTSRSGVYVVGCHENDGGRTAGGRTGKDEQKEPQGTAKKLERTASKN